MLKYLKILVKSLLYGMVSVFLLVFMLILLLRVPANQTLLAKYFSPKIEQAIGYPLRLERMQLKFFDEVSVWNLEVRDPWGKQMIHIDRLDVNFNLSELLLGGSTPTMEYARLIRPKVHLIFEKKDGKMNMDEFIQRLSAWLSGPNINPNAPSSMFTIREAQIQEGQFRLDDERLPSQASADHFDLSHFGLQGLNTNIHQFQVQGDSIWLKTDGLRAKDPLSKFEIKSLNTQFFICNTQMRFDDLSLYFNDSWLGNRMVMDYANPAALSRWNQAVRMRINFENARIQAQDLACFVGSIRAYPGMYRLKGALLGKVEDFQLKDFELGFGKSSLLKGEFSFKGLPAVAKTQMNFSMKESLFVPADLAIFISQGAADNMRILGPVAFSGRFVGDAKRFETSGKLNTGLGYVEAEARMNLQDSMALSSYDGKLALRKFKLGKLLNLEGNLGTVDLKGNLKGSGFSSKSANIDFDGEVSEIQVNKYPYQRISLKGNLQKQLFKGIVAVRDSHLLATMIGEINLRQEKPYYQLNGRVQRADLNYLNIGRDALRISTDFDVDIRMQDLDDLEGRVLMENFLLKKEGKPDLLLKNFQMQSLLLSQQQRRYRLQSDVLSADLEGDFVPSQLLRDLDQLWDEYLLYFESTAAERQFYYTQKSHDLDSKYHADFKVVAHHPAALLSRWMPSAHLSPNTTIAGSVMKGRSYNLSLDAYPDTLVLGAYRFYQTILSFQSSKYLGGPEVSSSLVFQSRKQALNFLTPTENLKLDALWDQDKIDFSMDIKQQGEENTGHLMGVWRFEDKGMSLKFKDSYFRILGQDWYVDPLNRIQIRDRDWKADHLAISSFDQSLSLQGSLSNDSTQVLTLRANRFQLGTLAPLFSIKSQGELNAEIQVKDWYNHSLVDAWLKVDSLRLGRIYMGNIQGLGLYAADAGQMDLNLNMDRQGETVLTMQGQYLPRAEQENLNLDLDLNRTKLNVLEPFLEGVFSKIQGDAVGKLRLGGRLSDPIITGNLLVQDGSMVFDYLNTEFKFSDTLRLLPHALIGRQWLAKDPEGNVARVNTQVNYPKDGDLSLDVRVDLNKFKLLNTQRSPNAIYYGKGYGTGVLKIQGPVQRLLISGDLKTEKGTQLYIPLDRDYGVEEAGDYEFFSKRLQTDLALNNTKASTQSSNSGLQMDLNLGVSPEAYGEVLFDSQTGDAMRVYGKGNVRLSIDAKGKFGMNGDYVMDQGDYTFTLKNIINKKFAIERNSKITWTGDPLDAQVDIKAIYTQYTSLFPILLDTTNKANLPEFKRRYPVDVSISLKNKLLSPDIRFDLGIRDYPKDVNFNGSVTAFSNRIRTDESELTRQVSNVLLFGQLVSPFGASGLSLGNLVGNVTEMLSNQLGNLASRINKDLNVEVSLGAGGLNQVSLNNLQLRASYNINNRLRISRSGGFTDARNQTSPQLLLGDWAMEYFARPDGSLKLKAYNRNIQTTLAGSLNSFQLNQTFGTSLIFQKNFNRLLPKK